MKKFNRLQLMVIKAALLIDEYEFNYNHYDYVDKIGTFEINRVRHVNDLIFQIADNSAEFTYIIKVFADDLDYLEYEIKESADKELMAQLSDARNILAILNEIA